ncbi:helix-turn-helix domain-containing protein [Meridianimaribacter flavus]|uniref:Regulatory LuxR family protein n=1 Tax=Meridianimaribacter flavus TaxID=571115 RepID=A0ABY2G1W9_9FLAO|nr:helix-turn-helix transcriptional regulator [Meridianimaribacter flavus]TDY07666.1 regulatory LuxR family protein [Meridianimaribacter flavus]
MNFSQIIKYVLLLVLCFQAQQVSAQYSPYFQNYSLSEYNAGNQNWDVSRADNGKLYVANNDGLLEYDGLKWNFYELPNKTTVRSVLAHNDIIYTGSYEEFGFWKKNEKGILVYKSLSQDIQNEISANDEIWQIIPFKNQIIFRAFSSIYSFKPEVGIEKIRPKSVIMSCSIVDDELLVSTLNNGIFTLVGNELKQIISDEKLVNTKVISIDKYREGLLLTTSLKGCFLYNGNGLIKTNFEVDDYIIQHQLNDFSILADGRMVFGTIKDGIYLTDSKGKVLFHLSKENGLVNNTVLRHHLDETNKLWLGLDNGLASLDLSSHNYFFNDVSGKLGAVYDVIDYKGDIYIGSNTGLFYLDKKNKLQFIEGSQGQVWNLKEINGELFCGHNDGTFLIKDKKPIPISNYTGGLTIKKVPEQKNVYIQGTYTGLVTFKNENNTWNSQRLGGGIAMPIRFLVFEDQNTAWVSHAYKGLYKVKFNGNYDKIISFKSYENKGIWSSFNVRVYKIKNDICFKTNDGWQKYEPLLDSIVPHKLLNESFGKGTHIISEDNVKRLVLKNENDVISFKSLAIAEDEFSLTSNYFKNRLIVGYENVSKISDSTYALNLIDGFMLIDDRLNETLKMEQPQVEMVEINKEPVAINEEKPIELKFNQSVGVSISSAKSDNHFFEYAFLGIDSSKWNRMENHKLELSNLNHGEYDIAIRASNGFGETSPVKELKINILPPWYKDDIGFALYTFLILLTLLVIFILHKRKIIKEQKILELKFEKQQEELLKEKTLENEKRIVQLKNESLQNEIKLKSKQLANTAMALVKKNETLQEIKQELVGNKTSFDNYYSYKKLLKKVDGSIAHKDEWKVFEYNFNQVHEEFFKGLKENHPQLTQKDLKICAYIKMNLSTKEIAPLMNISVRGVETHRYRLKKKLDLENDISLTDYLLNFK